MSRWQTTARPLPWRGCRLLLALGLLTILRNASGTESSPRVERLPPVSWQLEPRRGELIELPPLESEPGDPEDLDGSTDPEVSAPPGLKRDLGGPLGGPRRPPVGAQVFWMPAEDVAGQPGRLTINGMQFNAAAPLSISEKGIWLATGNVNRMEIGSSAILPDSGLPMPDQLWQIGLGALHFRELSNGWQAGGLLNVGSASDQPFAALRDMTLSTALFLNVPHQERNAWNFSLFYSPTAQVTFPIPGVAYVWRPNDRFQANLGIPFAMAWQATDNFSVVASYTPLTNVRLQMQRKLGERWALYGAYQIDNEIYWLADRAVDADRFFVFDQQVKMGLARQMGRGFTADVSCGYVFDREFFQSQQFSGGRTDVVKVHPGLLAGLQVVWTR